MAGPFNRAVATYLHEIDHKYGDDYSASFSYALTNTLEDVIKIMLKNSDIYSTLERIWEESLKREFYPELILE